MTAIAGDDAGEKNGSAFGSEEGDGSLGTLTIGDQMMVHAGQDVYDAPDHLFPYDQRVPACFYRPFAEIKACNHQDATYTVSGPEATDTHTLACLDRTEEQHSFGNATTCTVCGVSGAVSTISIYLPEKEGDNYTDGHYGSSPVTLTFVKGNTIALPAPPVSHLPNGITFAGWAVGTPGSLGITSYWKGSDETVLEAGTDYTVSADVSLTARYAGIEVSLADAADNREVLFQSDGQTAQRVTLTGRTLHKDGQWSTLCLPFDLPISGSPLDDDGVDVRTLRSSSFRNGTLTLYFTEAGAVSLIEAGKPYLIRWDNTGGTLTEADLVFSGVTIHNNVADAATDHIALIGTYSPHVIYQDGPDHTNLYLAADALWPPMSPDFTVNACRAYFQLKDGLTAGEPSTSQQTQVHTFVLNFNGLPTAISTLPADTAARAIYTLDGRRLDTMPTQRGLYIVNGKKVVIK